MLETKREKSKREKRLAAFLEIAHDPAAEVHCPSCSSGRLQVIEVLLSSSGTHEELRIGCGDCGRFEFLLRRLPE